MEGFGEVSLFLAFKLRQRHFLTIMKQKSYTFSEIKQKIANYCVYQDRSHQEVEQKLKEFLLIPEAKEEILLFLIAENYINEERFTRSYIRGKFYIKSWGKKKIANQLKMKGITEKLIRKCMDEINEQDYKTKILEIYRDYYDKLPAGAAYQKRSKTITYLIGKGYEYEDILEMLD